MHAEHTSVDPYSVFFSSPAPIYLCEGGEQVQHSSLLHRAGVVQVLLLQVDLHPVLFGQSGVLSTQKKQHISRAPTAAVTR